MNKIRFNDILHRALPGVGAGHTLGVDIVTQLLSTVVYPSPDVDLEQPQEKQNYILINRVIKIYITTLMTA